MIRPCNRPLESPPRVFPLLLALCVSAAAFVALPGCDPAAPTTGETSTGEPAEMDDHDDEPAADPNRVAIPRVVRENLGLTFARAAYRPVASTVTLPGTFEVLPSAQHHYPVPAAGRVAIHVVPLDTVEEGQLLLEIDAPDWRALQLRIAEAGSDRLTREAEVAQARAARLAAGAMGETPADTADDAEGIPDVYSTRIAAARAEAATAEERFERLLAHASTLTGLSVAELRAETEGVARWRLLDRVPIRATTGGVVREVDAATGTWVAESTEVVHVVQPRTLRFRARALQADLLDRLRDGQPVAIVPPEGRGAARRAAPVQGTVRVGVTGDPIARTTDVFVDFVDPPEWARPQVVALADVVVAGSDTAEELAIPTRAVITDGLEKVFFRRDPSDPDTVIRVVADLGPTDGRWTTVLSGLAEGDEVVVDGVYPLKLATTGRKVEAGHFHADGTWHEGED